MKQEGVRVRFTGLPEKAPEEPITSIAVECEGEPVQDIEWVFNQRQRRGVGV